MTDERLVRARLAVLKVAELNRPRALLVLKAFNARNVAGVKVDELERLAEEAEKELAALVEEQEEARRIAIEDEQAGTLTLRDQFAIAALAGSGLNHGRFGPTPDTGDAATDVADKAYRIADAMLARRRL